MEESDDEPELIQVLGPNLKKVANSKAKLKEFLIEELGLYVPSDRDCSARFFRQVLSGEKHLL